MVLLATLLRKNMKIQTTICTLQSEDPPIMVMGHNFLSLCCDHNFETLAYLLLNHRLPTDEELVDFSERGFASRRGVAQALDLDMLNNVKPMEMMQSLAASINYYFDPWDYMNQFIMGSSILLGAPRQALPNYEAQVLQILCADLYDDYQEKLEAATILLNLYSEHELAASTFTARVVASTGAQTHVCISSAIGALSGPLHGGANEQIIPFINQLHPSTYEEKLDERLARKEKIMGFGHAIYKDGDPRSPVAYALAQALAQTPSQQALLSVATLVADRMLEKKGLHPNLDYYAALALHFMGAKETFLTPFFTLSRITGWLSHIHEQRQSKTLIRPRASYDC